MHCSPRSCVSGGPAALLLMVIFRESLYGQYVASVLQQEIERHPGQVEHVQDEAVSIARIGETAEIGLSGLSGLLVTAVLRRAGHHTLVRRRMADSLCSVAKGGISGLRDLLGHPELHVAFQLLA